MKKTIIAMALAMIHSKQNIMLFKNIFLHVHLVRLPGGTHASDEVTLSILPHTTTVKHTKTKQIQRCNCIKLSTMDFITAQTKYDTTQSDPSVSCSQSWANYWLTCNLVTNYQHECNLNYQLQITLESEAKLQLSKFKLLQLQITFNC